MKLYKWNKDGKTLFKHYSAEDSKVYRCFRTNSNNADAVAATITQYAKEADGNYLHDIFMGAEVGIVSYHLPQEGDTLPPGVYRYELDEHGTPFLVSIENEINQMFVKANNPTLEILSKDINKFLDSKQIYASLGIPYKRGYLIYGPPGNGKTNYLLSLIGNHCIKDAIYILCEDKIPSNDFIEYLNDTHKGRTKVLIFEELTSALNIPGSSTRLLNLLDGLIGLDNYIIFATTNHPDQIPGNLIERPSRFDLVLKVDVPTSAERAAILEYFLKSPPSPKAIRDSDGLSIAILKEIAIRHLIHGVSLEDEIAKFHALRELAKKEFAEKKAFGFNND